MKKYNLKSYLKVDNSDTYVEGYYANKRFLKIASLLSSQLDLPMNLVFNLNWVLALGKDKHRLGILVKNTEVVDYVVRDKFGQFRDGPVATKKLLLYDNIPPANVYRSLLTDDDNPLDYYILLWLSLVCSLYKNQFSVTPMRGKYWRTIRLEDFSSYSTTYLQFRVKDVYCFIILEGKKDSVVRNKRGGKGRTPSKPLDNGQDMASQLQDLTISSVPKRVNSSAEITLNESLLRERYSQEAEDDFSL